MHNMQVNKCSFQKENLKKICSGPGSCIFGITLYCLPLKAINLSQAVGSWIWN